ncbi:hypothetical protein MRB53_005279 [Persea americana]|uniref:Uncharacterized protein n=1 Tax=Persea americana TaxID=3435 RepID=A0ACC2MD13_PERAE|nr:hypothetical protein MRB53_005279 [Persea americana]
MANFGWSEFGYLLSPLGVLDRLVDVGHANLQKSSGYGLAFLLRFDATREDFFGFYGFESESVVKLQLLCRSVEFMSFFFLIVSVDF